MIQDLLKKQGEPNAYIVGREGGGALVVEGHEQVIEHQGQRLVGVDVALDGNTVTVKGGKGSLEGRISWPGSPFDPKRYGTVVQ